MAMLFPDAPADVPEGFAYHADVMTEVEERALLDGLKALAFGEVRMRGQVARRRTIHFGWTYGYETWRVEPGPPIPAFLLGARSRVARLAGVDADTMAEVLVTHYPPGAGIGWHRDAPAFGVVVGVSLLGACRFRFQHGGGAARRTRAGTLAPRSAYVLDGAARWQWQPAIPPRGAGRAPVAARAPPGGAGAGAAAAVGPAGHLLRRGEHEPRRAHLTRPRAPRAGPHRPAHGVLRRRQLARDRSRHGAAARAPGRGAGAQRAVRRRARLERPPDRGGLGRVAGRRAAGRRDRDRLRRPRVRRGRRRGGEPRRDVPPAVLPRPARRAHTGADRGRARRARLRSRRSRWAAPSASRRPRPPRARRPASRAPRAGAARGAFGAGRRGRAAHRPARRDRRRGARPRPRARHGDARLAGERAQVARLQPAARLAPTDHAAAPYQGARREPRGRDHARGRCRRAGGVERSRGAGRARDGAGRARRRGDRVRGAGGAGSRVARGVGGRAGRGGGRDRAAGPGQSGGRASADGPRRRWRASSTALTARRPASAWSGRRRAGWRRAARGARGPGGGGGG